MVDIKFNKKCLQEAENFELSGIDFTGLDAVHLSQAKKELWKKIFPIYISNKEGSVESDSMAMLGEYRVEKSCLIFFPQYPLLPGAYYLACFDYKSFDEIFAKVLTMPKMNLTKVVSIDKSYKSSAQVVAIYPSGALLPENILRFYIYFSESMKEGVALSHIHLVDENQNKISAVFLDRLQELWDKDARRLTLFLDPGRVKAGLSVNRKLGRAFVPGKSYQIIIDKQWQDADGNELGSAYEKKFTVTAKDLIRPLLDKILPPKIKTQNAVTFIFNKPLDQVLLNLCIQIKDQQGLVIEGCGIVSQDEKVYQFIPHKPWQNKSYRVALNGRLEDVAGNNFFCLFDRARSRPKIMPEQDLINYGFHCSPG